MENEVYLDWIKDFVMSITSFDRRMFHQAYIEATKSTFDRFHVGCVVVYKGHVISRGHNSKKTHPVQQRQNRFRVLNNYDKPNNYYPPSIHAEVSALCSISYPVGINIKWDRVKIYVVRVLKNGDMACSKPCAACENLIRTLGIKGCYYSENNNCLAYIEYC